MDLASEFIPFQERITSSLLAVTRTAGQISAEDLSFHRSSNKPLSRSLDAQNNRLLRLTQKLIKAAATTGSNISPPKVQNAEDVDDNWRGLVDVIDDLLERADACLDEYTGVVKRLSPAAQDVNDNRSKRLPSGYAARQLPKPQRLFERSHQNHEAAPFKPLLRMKPHSIIDLDESIGKGGTDEYNHPYSTEIEQASYPESVRKMANPLPYMSPADSQAIFVDTREGVEEMLNELRQSTEIAIDLEHHDLHSYVGIVCLMQISTRQKDWIIDTLVPWREDLQILNEVFADSRILKVFQGSTMDMIWLQRDLGLYIVGLFDTFHASTALGFQQRSLKYLLERFCSFHAEKKYQMADWRIRPLPMEMLDYARSDTHYLLFIYDNLRNMLLEASSSDNNLIDYVLDESKKEALQRYERPMYDAKKGLGPVGWLMPLARRSVRFTPEQFGVYRAVHEWRDRTARTLDEGVGFVMTQATVFAIAEAMPTTVSALITVTNPVSKAISEASHELLAIIKMGQLAGREGPTVAEVMQENEAVLPRRRSTKRPAKYAQQGQGNDATSHKLDENGEIGSNADRSYISRLWGTVAKPFVTTAARFMAPLKDAQRLVLPLPPLDDASFTSPAQPVFLERAAESTTQPSPHTNGSIGNAESCEVFILKEIGRVSKRKAGPAELDSIIDDSPTMGLDANADYFLLGSRSVESAPTTENRAGQREEKRQRKALQDKEASHDAPIEPFDYANANSILHAKIDPYQSNSNGSAGGQAQFNPYTKGLDGPQGLKRARKETAGKSFTFKK